MPNFIAYNATVVGKVILEHRAIIHRTTVGDYRYAFNDFE